MSSLHDRLLQHDREELRRVRRQAAAPARSLEAQGLDLVRRERSVPSSLDFSRGHRRPEVTDPRALDNNSMMIEPTKQIERDGEGRERLAARFRALGDPTRLRIFECLRCCPGGVALEHSGAARSLRGATVGEICCLVTGEDRITSTLSHHLKELRLAGLILVEKAGRHRICRVNPEALAELSAYLAGGPPGEEKHDTCDPRDTCS